MTFKCPNPKCGSEERNKVVDSRPMPRFMGQLPQDGHNAYDGIYKNAIVRRRKCFDCGLRWYSFEVDFYALDQILFDLDQFRTTSAKMEAPKQ